jgi:Zn-finger nucleic acid-binding protein
MGFAIKPDFLRRAARLDWELTTPPKGSTAMQCPNCPASSLVISERSGVEIDYCPQCRGVWLDRGELDKLIDRAAGEFQPEFAGSTHPRPRPGRHRKSWLGEIFD